MTETFLEDPLKPFYQMVDKCFQNTPLIILGSGASMDFGFPSMKALGEKIKHKIESETTVPTTEKSSWDSFKAHFEEHGDFEKALDQMERSECATLRMLIIDKVWEIISETDRENYDGLLSNGTLLPLSILFEGLSRGNSKSLKVVTTNYDRMAEYAAELAEFNHYTGFNYGYIRLWDEQIRQMPLTVARRIVRNNEALSANNKLVDIWKVHGSIDWFKLNNNGKIFATPLPVRPTQPSAPLIVTPGIVKYQTTSSEPPFHVVLEEAKRSIEEAKSYMCIGYGFNDSHIQPNLVTKLQSQRSSATTIILAKELTPNARKIFLENQIGNFLLLEEKGAGTQIYTSEQKNGSLVQIPNLWKLEKFLEHFRKE